MIPDRDPTTEEIAWVMGYVSKRGWTPGRKGIVAHREAVRQNGLLGATGGVLGATGGHLGGRPAKDEEHEALRLEHIKRIRESDRSRATIEALQAQYEKDKERLRRAKEL